MAFFVWICSVLVISMFSMRVLVFLVSSPFFFNEIFGLFNESLAFFGFRHFYIFSLKVLVFLA